MESAREVMSLEDIASTVRKFESCEFTPQQFHHLDHLTVIVCYLEQMPVRRALDQMRQALRKFTAYHKAKGYNETITRFWVAKVTQIVTAEEKSLLLPELIERVHTALSNKELLFQYYSRELVLSDQAKAEWITPDLKEW